jgi:hypothetical protein
MPTDVAVILVERAVDEGGTDLKETVQNGTPVVCAPQSWVTPGNMTRYRIRSGDFPRMTSCGHPTSTKVSLSQHQDHVISLEGTSLIIGMAPSLIRRASSSAVPAFALP